LEAKNLDDALEQLTGRHIDVAIVSLSAIPERAVPYFQRLLNQAPATKVVALAPAHGGDGLTTLLLAESLHAHHLLAKPIDGEQFLNIIQLTCPMSTR
jgi:DNA-binding NtrC family response regulator